MTYEHLKHKYLLIYECAHKTKAVVKLMKALEQDNVHKFIKLRTRQLADNDPNKKRVMDGLVELDQAYKQWKLKQDVLKEKI